MQIPETGQAIQNARKFLGGFLHALKRYVIYLLTNESLPEPFF